MEAAEVLPFAARGHMDILVIEDDPVIGKALVQGFLEAGHECVWAKDGERGLSLAIEQQMDAIVLDLMLPRRDGLDVLTTFRSKGVQTPVVLLTALGSVQDRVKGLNSGADDYVVKPFAFSELLARVSAVCRRTATRPASVLKAGDLTLDLTTRRVSHKTKDVDLTPTEFSLLEFLMRYAGQVVTRKMLCEHVWDTDWDGSTNVIEVHVNRLRNKIERAGAESCIHTVRGRGYVIRAT